MKIAIMQPYFCPYIGYFQLINAVDKFVVYDDVQYIKDGWINRNRILIKRKEPYMFTLSVKNDSYTLDINQRYYAKKINNDKSKILKTIKQSYSKAPYYKNVIKLIDEIFCINELNIAEMNTKSLKLICKYLNINTPFYISSKLSFKDKNLDRKGRLIAINKSLGSDHYINLIGGVNLYNKEDFKKSGLKLNFLKPKEIRYKQFNYDFVPNLSIIDVMMFNGKEKLKDLLNEYELI